MFDRLTNRYSRIAVIPGKTYICGCDVVANYDGWTWTPENRTPPTREKCRTHCSPIAQEKDAKAGD